MTIIYYECIEGWYLFHNYIL